MNNVVNGLKAERNALLERLKKIENAIDEYERWERTVAALIGDGVSAPGNAPGVGASGTLTSVAEFEDEVRQLFHRVAAPLKRTEVYEALTEAGILVGGKDPLNTVASRLSRMSGIINLRGHGYWIEGRPYPPARYPEHQPPDRSLFDETKNDKTSESAAVLNADHDDGQG